MSPKVNGCRFACPARWPLGRAPRLLVAGLLALLAGMPQAAWSQAQPVPDTYSATTTGMSPSGITLKIDVKEWSDDDARAAAIAALSGEGDVRSALMELPTIGYVWPNGSAVGYALKYAHRTTTPNGGERITVVTDRPIGTYSFEPWTVADATEARDYSVIELRLDGQGRGVGTMSLAAEVAFDTDDNTVLLEDAETTPDVLTEARLEPKPYWARGGA